MSAQPILMQRTASTFEEIPVIDFADAKSIDPEARRALADLIRDACINIGFLYIKNHGIPEEKIATVLEASKCFFALETKTKAKLDIHQSANFKGYTALLGENTNVENHGDLHEGFDIGWEAPPGQTREDGVMSGDNVWPDSAALPGFKEAVLDYYFQRTTSMTRQESTSLDKYINAESPQTTKPAAIMRLLHYPPQPEKASVDDKIIGIGAHTDYECFTILWQDPLVQALQVQNATGKWIDAVPIPGTLVLNLGDQFARWTNDIFKSTVHRAINRSGAERYSMPLFFGTDYDVLLEPLPGCVTPDTPAKYEVITAGEYVKSRLEATYAHSAT